MNYRIMEEEDINKVLALYIDYYNMHEDSCWTEKTAYKGIHQVWSKEDSYSLIVEDNGTIIGFVVGYFEQYDDLIAYNLHEIVIDYNYQKKGIGTCLILELERRVKELGAAMVQLQAVNDDMHDCFYGKSGYKNANNFVIKTKWL